MRLLSLVWISCIAAVEGLPTYPYHPLLPSFGSFLLPLASTSVARRRLGKMKKAYKSILFYTALFRVPLSHLWKRKNFFLATTWKNTKDQVIWLVIHNIHPHKPSPNGSTETVLPHILNPPCPWNDSLFCWNQADMLIALDVAISDIYSKPKKLTSTWAMMVPAATICSSSPLSFPIGAHWLDLICLQIWPWQICEFIRLQGFLNIDACICLQIPMPSMNARIVVRLPLVYDKTWCKCEEVTKFTI